MVVSVDRRLGLDTPEGGWHQCLPTMQTNLMKNMVQTYFPHASSKTETKAVTLPQWCTRVFKTGTQTLRKQSVYRCRMCKVSVNSAKELKHHHQANHCKSFNNPLSLSRHRYVHTSKKHTCSKCGESFNFKSKLKTHNIVHLKCAKYFCVLPKCREKFKNKADFTRYAKLHSSKVLQCPDCSYSDKDKRNYDSHRLTHSCIETYFCEHCGQGFVFNTQKQRHLAKGACEGKTT